MKSADWIGNICIRTFLLFLACTSLPRDMLQRWRLTKWRIQWFFFSKRGGVGEGCWFLPLKFPSEALVGPRKVEIKLFTFLTYFWRRIKVTIESIGLSGSSNYLMRSNWSFSLSYEHTERQASAWASDWIPLECIVTLENRSQTHCQASPQTKIGRWRWRSVWLWIIWFWLSFCTSSKHFHQFRRNFLLFLLNSQLSLDL